MTGTSSSRRSASGIVGATCGSLPVTSATICCQVLAGNRAVGTRRRDHHSVEQRGQRLDNAADVLVGEHAQKQRGNLHLAGRLLLGHMRLEVLCRDETVRELAREHAGRLRVVGRVDSMSRGSLRSTSKRPGMTRFLKVSFAACGSIAYPSAACVAVSAVAAFECW